MFEGAQPRLALGRMLLSAALLACVALCAGSRHAAEAVENLAFEGDSELGSRAGAGLRAALPRIAPARTADGADDRRGTGRAELEPHDAAIPGHAYAALAGCPYGVRRAPPFAGRASRYEHPGALPGRGPPGHPGEVQPELPLG